MKKNYKMSDPDLDTKSDSIASREDLIAQLTVAAELEHGLCLQYLFSAASLKDSLDEGGMTLEELNYVRKWKANIYLIAAQEMLHLSQVANIVSALGFGVCLERPNFPQRPSYYPTNLPWGLWPFSPESIVLYALYERPSGTQSVTPNWLLDDTAMKLLKESECDKKDPFGFLPKKLNRPKSTRFKTIGELYNAISKGISDFKGDLIIGPGEAQIKGEDVDLPQLIEIYNREDILKAIELIIYQGEGAAIDRQDSHFGMFKQIYEEYVYLKAQRTDFEPVRSVQSNPLSRLHIDNTFPGWRIIDDDYTRSVNDLNSDIYRLMLLMIYRLFTKSKENKQEFIILSRTFLRIMVTTIKPLCELLTQLPMGDDGSPGVSSRKKYAGASFEMGRVIDKLPYSDPGHIYMKEELKRLSLLAVQLSKKYGSPKIMKSIAENLKRLYEQF